MQRPTRNACGQEQRQNSKPENFGFTVPYNIIANAVRTRHKTCTSTIIWLFYNDCRPRQSHACTHERDARQGRRSAASACLANDRFSVFSSWLAPSFAFLNVRSNGGFLRQSGASTLDYFQPQRNQTPLDYFKSRAASLA